jgi:integrase
VFGDVEAIGGELHKGYAVMPVFAVGTGLRPEERIALERGDIDRDAPLHDESELRHRVPFTAPRATACCAR